MKKAVFIIPPIKFRDEELMIPMNILKSLNIKTEIASTEIKTVFGTKGAEVNPEILIKDIKPEDFDAFIIVGGQGTHKYLWNYKPLLTLLKKADKMKKLVCGICAGSVVLGKAGLLKGINATTFPSEIYIDELKKSGANYTGNDLEKNNNIMTGRGPDDADIFGQELAEILSSKPYLSTHGTTSIHDSKTIPIHTPFDDI